MDNQNEMNDQNVIYITENIYEASKAYEVFCDLLDSEKLLCSVFQTATIEAATPNIRSEFKEVLNETLDIQNTIFDAMSKNGWYPIDAADPNKVQVAKSKYPQNVMVD